MVSEIVVEGLDRDEGSVVLFHGYREDDPRTAVVFGADHRCAQEIVAALETGADVLASVPDWSVLSSRRSQ